MRNATPYRRAFPLLLLLLLIAGCEGDRIVGAWEGTYEGEVHKFTFTATGRLLRSSDVIGGESGWTTWKTTAVRGQKVIIKAGGEEIMLKFKSTDVAELINMSPDSNIRLMIKRTGISVDTVATHSYALAYGLVILSVAFGLIAICRPSRRESA
jgi:hypothetical protein